MDCTVFTMRPMPLCTIHHTPCYLRAAKLQEDQDVQLQAVGQLASEHELRAEGLGSRIDSLRGTQVGETETRDSGPSNCTTIANYNAL